jgi:hypothetical protein
LADGMPRFRNVRQAGAQSYDVQREFLCAILQFLAHVGSIRNSHIGSRNCNYPRSATSAGRNRSFFWPNWSNPKFPIRKNQEGRIKKEVQDCRKEPALSRSGASFLYQ